MIRMSDVWDRATEVIAGRKGILVSIVLLLVWLPGLVKEAARMALGLAPAGTGAMPTMAVGAGPAVMGVLGLVTLALALVGQLALVAVASDPSVSRADALAIGLRRFGPYAGVMVLALVVGVLLAAPLAVTLAGAFPSLAAMRAGVPPQLSPGTGLFVLVYSIAFAVVLLWVQARLLWLLAPVIVNERLGLRSFARSFELTSGLTWRIVGVLLLFAVVAVVAALAVQGVAGVGLRLLLGASGAGLAQFLTTALVSLVSCAAQVVVAAFVAQLYIATRNGGAAALRRA